LPGKQTILCHSIGDAPNPGKPHPNQAQGCKFTDSISVCHLDLALRLALLFGTRCQRLVSVGMVIGAGGRGPIGNSICNIGRNLRSMNNHPVKLLRHPQEATQKQSTPQDEVDECDRLNHRGTPWAAIGLSFSKILELLGWGAHCPTANISPAIAKPIFSRRISCGVIVSPCRVAGLLVDLLGLAQMPQSSVIARSGYRSVRVIGL
jgi:hypothetical protein